MASNATGPGSDEPFNYTTDAGVTITVPSLAKIKAGVIRKTRKLEPGDQMFTIMEAVADEATLAAIDDMDGDELARFTEQWGAHSGADLGESAAS